jgi:hypothetical protein
VARAAKQAETHPMLENVFRHVIIIVQLAVSGRIAGIFENVHHLKRQAVAICQMLSTATSPQLRDLRKCIRGLDVALTEEIGVRVCVCI